MYDQLSLGLFDAVTQVLQNINNAQISGAIKHAKDVQFAEVNVENIPARKEAVETMAAMAGDAVGKPKVLFMTVPEFKKYIAIADMEFGNPNALVVGFKEPDTYQDINLEESLIRIDFLKTAMLQAWDEPSSAAHKAYKILRMGSPGEQPYFDTVNEAEASTETINRTLDMLSNFHGKQKFRGPERAKTIELPTGRFAAAIPRTTLATIQTLEGLTPGCEVEWARGQ